MHCTTRGDDGVGVLVLVGCTAGSVATSVATSVAVSVATGVSVAGICVGKSVLEGRSMTGVEGCTIIIGSSCVYPILPMTILNTNSPVNIAPKRRSND